MQENENLSSFLDPRGVVLIGASRRPDSWGNMIAKGLRDSGYGGALYIVNAKAQEIMGIPCYPSLEEVPGHVELAIVTVPAEAMMDVLRDCARKRVKGIVIISSGFGEALGSKGKEIEQEMALFARMNGMRLLGPNVSGIYNLNKSFYATTHYPHFGTPTGISFLSQGGFAAHNIFTRAGARGIHIGKFVHTGNEADLQITDFLKALGKDPETHVILVYLEGLKEPRRFLEIARRISPEKPIVVYKGGKSEEGVRAAASHTGAMSGSFDLYQALFKQAGCIVAPNFEIMPDLGYAFTFYPPLKGPRVGIITQGGSWGVMLTDHLSLRGLRVPELSSSLQKKLRGLGMPYRASTKNPVDFGAAFLGQAKEAKLGIVEAMLSSTEIDALILHGYGIKDPQTDRPQHWISQLQREQEEILRRGMEMMRAYKKPFVLGSYYVSHLESRTIRNLVQDGIPVFNSLEDIANLLRCLYHYYRRRDSVSTA
ncbi:MAG: CoA-binding protein [Deltaproteobacteria bacterium]|nr:CoA-binding protein [Deltaproteobacteria bacterium]